LDGFGQWTRVAVASCDMPHFAGTATKVCCESTARDAMMLDYRVIMLSDANATLTDEEHTATLNSFLLFFGDVMTVDSGGVPQERVRGAADQA
jgi:ureidoacrylate peracid hydrolase